MSNPLMQAMGAPSVNAGGANAMASLAHIMQMLRSGNPEQIAKSLMQQNPQFRAFVEANKGKSPEQVAREHGVDLSSLMNQV